MNAPPVDKSTLPDPSYHSTTLKARVFLGAQTEGRGKRQARRRARRKPAVLLPESDIFGLAT